MERIGDVYFYRIMGYNTCATEGCEGIASPCSKFCFGCEKLTWLEKQVQDAAAQLDEPEASNFRQRIEEYTRMKQMVGRAVR